MTRYEALAILGLQDGSGESKVRKAYRSQAMAHHPDRGGDPERFMRIQEAYEFLLSSSKVVSEKIRFLHKSLFSYEAVIVGD